MSMIKHREWSQEPIQHEVKPSVVWCLETPHRVRYLFG